MTGLEIARERIFSSPIMRAKSPSKKIPAVCACCRNRFYLTDGQYIQGFYSTEHKAFWGYCKKCTASISNLVCPKDIPTPLAPG
jgi:hypothetical protein